MPTLRWSVAIVIAALGAGAALYLRGWGGSTTHAEASRELVGHVESPGLDPARVRVRCTPVRLETGTVEHWAEVERDGRFRIPDLADTDYRLEVVARHDPSFVLGQLDFVRPGHDPLVVAADPTRLWDGADAQAVSPNTD